MASEGDPFIIAVYVDEILLAGEEDKQMLEVKQALSKRFQVKDMGELHDFLGVKIVHDQHIREVWIGQPGLTKTILQKFGKENCNAISTPVDTSTKLTQAEEHDECFINRPLVAFCIFQQGHGLT